MKNGYALMGHYQYRVMLEELAKRSDCCKLRLICYNVSSAWFNEPKCTPLRKRHDHDELVEIHKQAGIE